MALIFIGVPLIRSMQREKKAIMLHFSVFAVVACIGSMMPLRQAWPLTSGKLAKFWNQSLSCLTSHLHKETYTLR